ncbi:MAG: carboxypeptidase-like regulatory domain-containing protein [Nitrospiraceae bacterium]|nr:carboxypeptidase-like regulatory domain-containing protein [Nitrospiraceae bacterium]
MKKRLSVLIVLISAAVFSAGTAMANGTITATFLYNGSGVDQPLDHAYVYLHAYPPAGSAIMGKYFRNAQYVLGPSDANGAVSVSVPEGTYKIMMTRRAPLTAAPTQSQAYGPPRSGDYTWHLSGSASSVTVTANSVVNLGVVYATIFGGDQPITVSGTVTGASGKVLAGWAVKATTVPCKSSTESGYSNRGCGNIQYVAPQLTDANGNYAIRLRNPGTYYIYASPTYYKYGGYGVRDYPGGYPTCSTAPCSPATTCEQNGVPFYYNCPLALTSAGATGVNVVAPGY